MLYEKNYHLCPKCHARTTKDGSQSGRQRYRCTSCDNRFQFGSKQQVKKAAVEQWEQYVWGKQTYAQLGGGLGLTRRTVATKLKTVETPLTQPYQEVLPQPIVLVIDAFYWKRGDGVMLFRAVNLKRNLLWFPVQSETVGDYLKGVGLLIQVGWKIEGFVIDGRKGVTKALEPIAPVQYCQFHQTKTIKTYLTSKPQLQPAIELKAIADRLTVTDQASFEGWLGAWHDKWSEVLRERTVHLESRRWSYTHKRLRSAYYSLAHNLPWLYTYQDRMAEPNKLAIPNTTNSLDGSISHLRTKVRVHSGVKKLSRQKITDTLLRAKTPKNLP